MYSRNNWNHIGFEKGKGLKKYNAVLEYKTNPKRKVRVSFGNRTFNHYYDKIGSFRYLNHNDMNRRRLYHLRHKDLPDDKTHWTPNFFSKTYLW